jgi:hypothetical protein
MSKDKSYVVIADFDSGETYWVWTGKAINGDDAMQAAINGPDFKDASNREAIPGRKTKWNLRVYQVSKESKYRGED